MAKGIFCIRWVLLYILFPGIYFLSFIKAAAQNEAGVKNCDGRTDAKTGKQVATAPLGRINISAATTIQGAGSQVIDDINPTTAYNPKSGQDFICIACDSLDKKQSSLTISSLSKKPTTGSYHYNPIVDMITIQAGIAFTILYGNAQHDARFSPAFFFGAGLRLPVVTRFYIDPSIKFSQAGSNYKQGDKYKLGYIDVDADAEYDWCDPDMYGEIGVRGRINTSADLKYNGSSYNEKKYFKSTDAGINAELGWKATRKFAVSVNFYLGLINIYNTTNTTGTGKNMSVGIGGRYCLN